MLLSSEVQSLLRKPSGGGRLTAWHMIAVRAEELGTDGLIDSHQIAGAVYQLAIDRRTVSDITKDLTKARLLERAGAGKWLVKMPSGMGANAAANPAANVATNLAASLAEPPPPESFDEPPISSAKTAECGDETGQFPTYAFMDPYLLGEPIEEEKEKNKPTTTEAPSDVETTAQPTHPEVGVVVSSPAASKAPEASPEVPPMSEPTPAPEKPAEGSLGAAEAIAYCRSKGYWRNIHVCREPIVAQAFHQLAPITIDELRIGSQALKAKQQKGETVSRPTDYLLAVVRGVRQARAEAGHPRHSDAPGKPAKKIEQRPSQEEMISVGDLASGLAKELPKALAKDPTPVAPTPPEPPPEAWAEDQAIQKALAMVRAL